MAAAVEPCFGCHIVLPMTSDRRHSWWWQQIQHSHLSMMWHCWGRNLINVAQVSRRHTEICYNIHSSSSTVWQNKWKLIKYFVICDRGTSPSQQQKTCGKWQRVIPHYNLDELWYGATQWIRTWHSINSFEEIIPLHFEIIISSIMNSRYGRRAKSTFWYR